MGSGSLGIELGPPPLGVWRLRHWTTREDPEKVFLSLFHYGCHLVTLGVTNPSYLSRVFLVLAQKILCLRDCPKQHGLCSPEAACRSVTSLGHSQGMVSNFRCSRNPQIPPSCSLPIFLSWKTSIFSLPKPRCFLYLFEFLFYKWQKEHSIQVSCAFFLVKMPEA